MLIIVKLSDKTTYLLHGGKIISLAGSSIRAEVPSIEVSDAVFTRLTTAYGAAVT